MITSLYSSPNGKLAHKWQSYLPNYQRHLGGLASRPLRLLEIGVQNGGSLEIWAQFFPNARVLVGCDIDPLCANLRFQDPRIRVLQADVNSPDGYQLVTGISEGYDVIIDDGSHQSGDIIRAFCKYFHLLSDGGLYIAEDLHCSYWEAYGGGLFDPYSSLSFFKLLCDVINREHWGVALAPSDLMAELLRHHGAAISDLDMMHIQSIEFSNSMCFIRKASPDENNLGLRVLAGQDAEVDATPLTAASTGMPVPNESGNGWSQFNHSPAGVLSGLLKRLDRDPRSAVSSDRLMALVRGSDATRIAQLTPDNETMLHAIESLRSSASWKITMPFRVLHRVWQYGLTNICRAVARYLSKPEPGWDAEKYVAANWIHLDGIFRKYPRLHRCLFPDDFALPGGISDSPEQSLPQRPDTHGLKVNRPDLCSDREIFSQKLDQFVLSPTNRPAFFGQLSAATGLGLEIGPLHSPICRRPACNVRYLDVFSTKELKRNYRDDPNVQLDQVVEVDYVYKGGSYRDLMPECFDYIVTSHNIEHVPCLVSFLKNLESCLKVGGRVFAALPDKRYCFDHFKVESSVVDVVDAYFNKAQSPSPKDLVRHEFLMGHNDSHRHWSGDHGLPRFLSDPSVRERCMTGELAERYARGGYTDTHVWILTPGSFAEIIEILNRENLTNLRIASLYPTAVGSHEFYVVLENRPDT